MIGDTEVRAYRAALVRARERVDVEIVVTADEHDRLVYQREKLAQRIQRCDQIRADLAHIYGTEAA